ncbi:glycosyltransferase family 9 protein [Tengunoibacter tsumagoiensis]|uniref:Glycosyl transferase n=1 Tax=Tengunoibacter tsumagoiensis TaxID=2014871 RepID=A0A402A360_9CHLR|nr:glycosyltransferase family 9 protein [Tengunoibacter tsumagoiensis]GCE13479.1 glycosyl transferase [Tengunoibacter tsumagoiensis]
MKLLFRSLLLLIIRFLGAPGALLARRRPRPGVRPRILLLRPDHLGDLVLTTPVLSALRTALPEAHLTMMVGPWSSEIVERHPALDELLTFPFPGFQRAPQGALAPYRQLWQAARQLRQGGYDLAINLRPDFWWGAALIYLAGIPQRIGYALQPGAPFLTEALSFPHAEHATRSNLRLASAAIQALGAPALPTPYSAASYPLYFRPTSDEHKWVEDYLQQIGITPEGIVVVIHAGTGGAVKLWRTDGWATLADQLARGELSLPAASLIFTGSPKELPLLEEIAQQMQTSSPIILTTLTVGQLAALLGRAQLVLGVDNGPLHLAVSQDTPSMRMYGPTDDHIFGPWGDTLRHVVLNATQKCADCPSIPCGRLDFTSNELATHPCVRLITEQRVAHAVKSLVQLASR